MTGSPSESAHEFLLAMNRRDAAAARMACEPASGIPIEAALRFEPDAWGADWTLRVVSQGEESAEVEAEVAGLDGRRRRVNLSVVRFVRWHVSRMSLEGRSLFGPAELPAGVTMPEIADVEVAREPSGGGWSVTVRYTAGPLSGEARADGTWANVTRALILRAPDGSVPYRMETRADAKETAPGRFAFSETLRVQGAPGRYVLHVALTDSRSLLGAAREIEITLP